MHTIGRSGHGFASTERTKIKKCTCPKDGSCPIFLKLSFVRNEYEARVVELEANVKKVKEVEKNIFTVITRVSNLEKVVENLSILRNECQAKSVELESNVKKVREVENNIFSYYTH